MSDLPVTLSNPYLYQSRILPLISDELIQSNSLEPQIVRIRSSNLATMYIDAARRPNITQIPTNITLGSTNNQIFARKIIRLSVQNMAMEWITPNVNVRNNVVTFFSTTSAAEHSVTVLEGFYLTPLAIMDALVLALNTATGASGLTFSHAIPTLNPIKSTLSSAGGSYHFNLDSLAIIRGRNLWNLPRDQTNTTSKMVGAIHLRYTRYVDIISFVLTEHTKNQNISNSFGANNLLFRLFINSAEPHLQLAEERFTDITMNYNRTQNIRAIDFKLIDEFGQTLYVPGDGGVSTTPTEYAEGTDSGFVWDITITLEI